MFNKYETKTYNRHQAMPSFHGKKKNKFIIINGYVCVCFPNNFWPGYTILQQTGYSDSNLLSPQNEGEKHASYSAAVQWNFGEAAPH